MEVIRPHHNHLLTHVPSNGEAEAPANHIAEKIEEDVIKAPLVEAELFEELKAMNDATPATAPAHLRAS